MSWAWLQAVWSPSKKHHARVLLIQFADAIQAIHSHLKWWTCFSRGAEVKVCQRRINALFFSLSTFRCGVFRLACVCSVFLFIDSRPQSSAEWIERFHKGGLFVFNLRPSAEWARPHSRTVDTVQLHTPVRTLLEKSGKFGFLWNVVSCVCVFFHFLKCFNKIFQHPEKSSSSLHFLMF